MIIKYSFLLKDYFNYMKIKNNLRIILVPLASLLIVAYISGYFEISAFDAMGLGYGFYSFNLAGFIDPQTANDTNWSIFLKILKTQVVNQGFSYLGFGGIILFIFFLINFFRNKPSTKHLKLPIAIIFNLFCFINFKQNLFGQ